MKRWLIVLAVSLGLLAPAAAFWQSRDSNYNVAISGGGGGYTAQGIHFSSTAPQFMDRGAALTGVTDGTVGAVSFWFRAEGNDANVFRVFSDTVGAVLIDRLNSGVMRLTLTTSSSSNLFQVSTVSTVFTAANGNWHNYLASWNTGGSSNLTIYVDGVLDTSTSGTAGTINYATSETDYLLPSNGLPMDADVADFWFDTGIAFSSQLNLSVLANRQKFINGGNAVNLGASGQTPSGTSPPVFFSGAVASWNTNKGSGGGFTLNNGPLTAASSNPP